MHAVEYSADRGESWRNGAYHHSRSFTLEGLPTTSNLKSPREGQQQSEWSDAVMAAVL